MKKSMQVIAMAAFLGCFAILAIAAGGKTKSQEGCSEEWRNTEKGAGDKSEENKPNRKPGAVAAQWKCNPDELIFPGQYFLRYI